MRIIVESEPQDPEQEERQVIEGVQSAIIATVSDVKVAGIRAEGRMRHLALGWNEWMPTVLASALLAMHKRFGNDFLDEVRHTASSIANQNLEETPPAPPRTAPTRRRQGPLVQ